jgi:hypothetical protein
VNICEGGEEGTKKAGPLCGPCLGIVSCMEFGKCLNISVEVELDTDSPDECPSVNLFIHIAVSF